MPRSAKGPTSFFEAAQSLPQHDFIWVGNWSAEDAPENTIYSQFADAKLANLFVSGSVSNPYKYISKFDLFFLSSREDPNPVVLAEALILRCADPGVFQDHGGNRFFGALRDSLPRPRESGR